MTIAEEKNDLISLLKDKEYRDAFVAASVNIGVPAQIRTLRKQRDWSEGKLADEAKMKQPAISRLEDPERGSVNLKTLLRLAAAFNVGLMVRFVPFSEMVDWKLRLSLKSMEVESFDKEQYFKGPSNEEIINAQKILGVPLLREQQSLQFPPYLVSDNKQSHNKQKQIIKYNTMNICMAQDNIALAREML